jgi:hypothetical protein
LGLILSHPDKHLSLSGDYSFYTLITNLYKISATYDNGILELRLPRAEEVKAKKIEIKAQISEGINKKRQQKLGQEKS